MEKGVKFKIYVPSASLGLRKDADILLEAFNQLGYPCEICNSNKKYTKITRFFVDAARKINFLYFYKIIQRFLARKTGIYAIHLEIIDYLKLYQNETPILIPNQEWFFTQDIELLYFIKKTWCKTKLSQHIFTQLGCKTHWIGFSTAVDDSHAVTSKSKDYFFTRVGNSFIRGAQTMVDMWRKHPEWPPLKMVIDADFEPAAKPDNVEYIARFPKLDDYLKVATGTRMHIYMTETEGFGHAIVESMGYGAVSIITDAPPMNELANTECALMVKSAYVGQKMLSPLFAAEPQDMERAITQMLTMSEESLDEMSNKARRQYEALRDAFPKQLDAAVVAL